MKPYDVVGLMYTRTCPLTCKHCITQSSPSAKGRMRLDQARAYLPAIQEFSPTVCFTGGEPLLYYKDILRLTQDAKALGLDVTVVTGAGWVREEKAARLRMQELARSGVSTICISWDRYHEEFVPRERAILLARLAVEAGLDVKVRSVIPATDRASSSCQEFDGMPIQLQSVRLIPLGRASSLPASHLAHEDEPPRGVCSVIRSPSIGHDGTVYACCGPSLYSAKSSPLVLGNANAEPLEDIFARALQNPILQVIQYLGSYGFYALLKDHPAAQKILGKRRAGYSTICDLCLDVTNGEDLVAAVMDRLQDHDAQTLLTAARLWHNKKVLRVAGVQRNIGSRYNRDSERAAHANQ
jgi:hypothetical protein